MCAAGEGGGGKKWNMYLCVRACVCARKANTNQRKSEIRTWFEEPSLNMLIQQGQKRTRYWKIWATTCLEKIPWHATHQFI